MTDEELFARLGDVEALALTLFGEARGEPLDGQVAVAWVVRNRMKDSRWPDSIKAVCLQPKQFSAWNPGRDANAQAVRVLGAAVVLGEAPHSAQWPLYRQAVWVATGVMDGLVLDTSKAANHYLAETIYRLATPKWATTMTETARIGGHVFLRG